MNKIIIKKEDWYDRLVEDCRAIITETGFNSRWALIEGYYELGRRILEENDNFEREKVYGEKICQRVGESLGRSRQTINYAMQFAWKYPVLNESKFGKNISWHKIVNYYLPGKSDKEDLEICQHEWKTVVRCVKCWKNKEDL